MINMSNNNIIEDNSIDWTISKLINSYLCPSFPIFRIKFLYSESYNVEIKDRDGGTGEYEAKLKQKIFESLFEIIPDIFFDNDVKMFICSINKKKNQYLFNDKIMSTLFVKNKIPESLFLRWINMSFITLLQNNTSYFYLSHEKIYSSNKLYNAVKEQNNLKKNVFDCILQNNNLVTQYNSFYRINYEVYRNINNNCYLSSKSSCILETFKQDIIFKSDIKKNSPNLTWFERACNIENLKNNNKILESNPVSYFLESLEKLKISIDFLLNLKDADGTMTIQYDNQVVKIIKFIRLV